MTWIHKLIRRQNLKWLITQHSKALEGYASTAIEMITWGNRDRTAINDMCKEKSEPHKKEIERLYKQLEEL